MNNLLIITGAGASHDAASSIYSNVSIDHKPPLTSQLFLAGKRLGLGATHCVVDYLKRNPIAAQVGYDCPHNQHLETYLASVKNNRSKELRDRYWSIPIYLHELFLAISNGYIISDKLGVPSNYTSLITAVIGSAYDQIIWINLNYDLLVDYAINASSNVALNTLDDYMNIVTKDGIKIKYTKPHGSVNWYRRNVHKITWDDIKNNRVPDDFENRLSKEIYTEHTAMADGLLYKEIARFPAISAPLGKYEYIYQKHIDMITPLLKETGSVLCVGFSAFDDDILTLMANNIRDIKKLKIVSGGVEEGRKIYGRIAESYMNHGKLLSVDDKVTVSERGFTDFIKSGEINDWLSL